MEEKYKIKELKNNIDVDIKHPSSSTFDILTEYNSNLRWLSVPHELYFQWALLNSKPLELYIESKNFLNWEAAINDLIELNYDWNTEMGKYLDEKYKKKHFLLLPEYSPDSFEDDFDDDDD